MRLPLRRTFRWRGEADAPTCRGCVAGERLLTMRAAIAAKRRRGTSVAMAPRMNLHHAMVWIDHHEARIFAVDGDAFDAKSLSAPRSHVRRHPETTAGEKGHPADEQRFYHEVARALEGAAEVLVVGPGTAKLGFVKHVHKHDAALEPKLVGVETVDHPTDAQLVAYAKKYFVAADRMRGIGR